MKAHQIYFLRRRDGLIKIGTTTDLTTRIEALAAAHGPLDVVRVINGDLLRERQLHQQFRAYRQFGEWFADPEHALIRAIALLPEGTAVEVAKTDADAAWIEGEAELMTRFVAKVEALIKARMDRALQKRAEAMESLTADYGFPKWFLWYSRKGRATTVSAYAFERLREALVTEQRAYLAQLQAEIATMEEHAALLAKIQAKREAVK